MSAQEVEPGRVTVCLDCRLTVAAACFECPDGSCECTSADGAECFDVVNPACMLNFTAFDLEFSCTCP